MFYVLCFMFYVLCFMFYVFVLFCFVYRIVVGLIESTARISTQVPFEFGFLPTAVSRNKSSIIT